MFINKLYLTKQFDLIVNKLYAAIKTFLNIFFFQKKVFHIFVIYIPNVDANKKLEFKFDFFSLI